MRRMGKVCRVSSSGLVLLTAVFCFLTAALGAPPVELQVTTNAIKILPERNLSTVYGTLWAKTNAVAQQGTILRWAGQQYMAENTGTLGTNAPVFKSGSATNGTVVLRYVEKGPRLGFILMLNSAGSIRVNLNSAAVPGTGIRLEGEKSSWQESDRGAPQGAIWAVSDSGTNTVAALEW